MSEQRTHLPVGAGSAGDEVVAQLAASVIVVRGQPLEVLLMRRTDASTFVPGAWIFPGGSIELSDEAMADELALTRPEDRMKVTATRELLEESGIWLGAREAGAVALRQALDADNSQLTASLLRPAIGRLVWTARWITPTGMPKRYDTYFYIASVEEDEKASPDHVEGMELRWLTPDNALQLNRAGELPMVLPTVKNIAALRGFATPEALIASRAGVDVRPIQPRLVFENGRKRIAMPDEA